MSSPPAFCHRGEPFAGCDLFLQSFLSDIMLEDGMGSRRPAYVSKAHEKDFVSVVECFHYLTIIRSMRRGTEVIISYGMVPRMSASSVMVGSSPKIVTVSPTLTSIPVTSSMVMSMQMLPIVGTRCPLIVNRPLPQLR